MHEFACWLSQSTVLGFMLRRSKAQAAGFGPLQEGLVLNCSSALVRQLLGSPPPMVRVTPI